MKPEQKFSAGGVTATVWINSVNRDGKETKFPSVKFDRRYKNKDGEWKSSTSLNLTDIPKAIMVLGKTYEYLALKKTESQNE